MLIYAVLYRDRPIYQLGRYLGIADISASAKTQPQQVLSKCFCIPHTYRQLVLESTTNQVKIVILQRRKQVLFHKQVENMKPEACIRHRSQNKSIIINQIN